MSTSEVSALRNQLRDWKSKCHQLSRFNAELEAKTSEAVATARELRSLNDAAGRDCKLWMDRAATVSEQLVTLRHEYDLFQLSHYNLS